MTPEEPKNQEPEALAMPMPPQDITHIAMPIETLESTPDHPPQPWLNEVKPPGKKKGFIIGGGVLAVLLSLGFGSWAAYALWYQSPDKVVMDAIVNAVTAKTVTVTGTMTSKDADLDMSATMDGQFGYEEGASGSLKLALKPTDGQETTYDVQGVHTPTGGDYLKLNNLKPLYQQFSGLIDTYLQEDSSADPATKQQVKQLLDSIFVPIIEKIDNKWVRFSSGDFKNINSKIADEYECVSNALNGISKDTSKQMELSDRYQKNTFIVVKEKLGVVDGSEGYLIDIDKDKRKQFFESLKDTKVYKDIEDCSSKKVDDLDNELFGDEDSKSVEDLRFELWVSQWGHQITKVHVDATSKESATKGTYALDLIPHFNAPITINVPKDTVEFKDVLAPVVEGLFGQIFGAGTSEDSGKTSISGSI